MPCRKSHCDLNATPSITPGAYRKASSGRDAVIFGSSWRSAPAAALRGLANIGSPASSRSWFIFANPDRGIDHLAAHFEDARDLAVLRMLQSQRHALDRADILRDVFAVDAVAARRSDRQPPVVVNQLDAETVELDLGDVLDVGVGFQQPLDALVELAHLLGVHRVAERHHRPPMHDDAEFFAGRRTHTLRGRIGRGELGMLALDRFEPAHQLVVFGVGNFGIVVDVVAIVGAVDLVAQLFSLRRGLLRVLAHRGQFVFGRMP